MKITKKEKYNFNNWYTKSNDYWNFSYRVSEKDRMARTVHLLHKYLKGSNKTALDIGCGNAIFTNEIAKVCENVIAMDISEVVIAEAKQKKDNKIDFRVGHLPNISLDINFDVIFTLEILNYLSEKDLTKSIENIYNSLNVGGYFYYSGLTENNYISLPNIKEKLLDAGFKIVEVDFTYRKIFRKVEGLLLKVLGKLGVKKGVVFSLLTSLSRSYSAMNFLDKCSFKFMRNNGLTRVIIVAEK